MSGSSPELLAAMAAFWVEFEAEPDETERQRIRRRWLLANGGRTVEAHNIRAGEALGDVRGGLEPVKVP